MIYIAVLIVAAIALAWDKISRDNSETSAPCPAQQPSICTEPSAEMVQKLPDFHKLAVTLKKTTSNYIKPNITPHNTRDVFAASDGFLKAINRQVDQKLEPPMPPDPRDALCLSGIVIGQHTRYAMINEQVFYPGQYIGGYRLDDVKNDFVTLKKNDEQIILFIDDKNTSDNETGPAKKYN